MNRYQLAKIVEWAGTLRARKRMQKLIYLLQAAGCPLDVDYDLHHYGPYSEDVARTTDEMVREKLLGETTETYSYGEQYSYSLTPRSIDQIHRYEAEARGLEDARKIKPFEQLVRRLAACDLKELEVGSTIVFFRGTGHDWPTAIEKTCVFKNLASDTPMLKNCEQLVRSIMDRTGFEVPDSFAGVNS